METWVSLLSILKLEHLCLRRWVESLLGNSLAGASQKCSERHNALRALKSQSCREKMQGMKSPHSQGAHGCEREDGAEGPQLLWVKFQRDRMLAFPDPSHCSVFWKEMVKASNRKTSWVVNPGGLGSNQREPFCYCVWGESCQERKLNERDFCRLA